MNALIEIGGAMNLAVVANFLAATDKLARATN